MRLSLRKMRKSFCLSHWSFPLHLFPSVSHWVHSCVTWVNSNWDTPAPTHTHTEAPSVSHAQARLWMFFCLPLCTPPPPPSMCTAGQSFANKPAHARSALSAWSGFNWMTGVPLTAAVGFIQTLRCSHRLQQVPPLSMKANPLSPARWHWLRSHGVIGGQR